MASSPLNTRSTGTVVDVVVGGDRAAPHQCHHNLKSGDTGAALLGSQVQNYARSLSRRTGCGIRDVNIPQLPSSLYLWGVGSILYIL